MDTMRRHVLQSEIEGWISWFWFCKLSRSLFFISLFAYLHNFTRLNNMLNCPIVPKIIYGHFEFRCESRWECSKNHCEIEHRPFIICFPECHCKSSEILPSFESFTVISWNIYFEHYLNRTNWLLNLFHSILIFMLIFINSNICRAKDRS